MIFPVEVRFTSGGMGIEMVSVHLVPLTGYYTLCLNPSISAISADLFDFMTNLPINETVREFTLYLYPLKSQSN